MSHLPQQRIAIDTMQLGQPVVFEFERAGETLEAVVIRLHGGWSAFVNRCPHWNVDLDMGERRFISKTTGLVVCSNHGALFNTVSGHCEWGPCEGKSLEMLTTWEEGEELVVVFTAQDRLPVAKDELVTEAPDQGCSDGDSNS